METVCLHLDHCVRSQKKKSRKIWQALFPRCVRFARPRNSVFVVCIVAAMILISSLLDDNKPSTISEAAHSTFATSTPVIVLLCANRHGSKALIDDLTAAVASYNDLNPNLQTQAELVVDKDCPKARWKSIGTLLFERLTGKDGNFHPSYALLITDHDQYPLSLSSSTSLINTALAEIMLYGFPDILGAAAQVKDDPSLVLPGALPLPWAKVTPKTVSRNDDSEWWKTGRPHNTSIKLDPSVTGDGTLQSSTSSNSRQKFYRHAAYLSSPQNAVTIRPCFMLPRKQWTMRLLPSSTGFDCDAVGSSFLVNTDLITNFGGASGSSRQFYRNTVNLRRKVWSVASSASLDTGLLDFFITLKRARWGLAEHSIHDKEMGTGIAAATRPWFLVSSASSDSYGEAFAGTSPSFLDGIGVEWFSSLEMHRHGETLSIAADSLFISNNLEGGKEPSGDNHRSAEYIQLAPPLKRVSSTIRQRAMISVLSRRHDLREIEAPDGSVIHIGCSADQGRCPMNFVERGFSMPPCCRTKLRKLLLYMSHALTQRGVLHWIDFGTLIGAVRTSEGKHKVSGGKLLGHDYDADIVVDARQWNFVRAMQIEVVADGHILFEEQEGFSRFFFSAHNGVYVDLYAAQPARPSEVPSLKVVRDQMARDLKLRENGITGEHSGMSMWYLSAGKQDWFDSSYIFPLGQCLMEGELLPCPNRPKEFLEKWRANLYGGKRLWEQVSRKKYRGPRSESLRLRGHDTSMTEDMNGPQPMDFMDRKTKYSFVNWLKDVKRMLSRSAPLT